MVICLIILCQPHASSKLLCPALITASVQLTRYWLVQEKIGTIPPIRDAVTRTDQSCKDETFESTIYSMLEDGIDKNIMSAIYL